MSLDTPPSVVDPDVVAGATSLRTRYHAQHETRNPSTDEQFDGESFRLSRRPPGSSGPTVCSSLTGPRSDYVDSDAEVEVVVRKASSRHHELAPEPIGTDNSQNFHQTDQNATQTSVHGQTRGRSKTTSSIPQNPSSFVRLARDKLLRMESDPSFAFMASSSTSGSHNDMANVTPSPRITTDGQPFHHSSSTPRSSFSSTPEEMVRIGAPETAGRVQSAPVRREPHSEQDVRPNSERSQSDTAVRSSPRKAGFDRPSDVRKRIEELEAKMRGGAK